MPEEGIRQIPRTELLDTDEIVRICKAASELGISRIKLTGGEPLVRRICTPLVKELKAIPGICQVTLTTNGILLGEQLPGLMEAGLDAVNISLDTLEETTFRKITRRDDFHQVLKGLRAALSYPSLKVKLNCVPTFQSDEELLQVAALARENPLHVRFIEMMPIGEGSAFPPVKNETIQKRLEEVYGEFVQTEQDDREGPAVYYTNAHFKGRIGFISPVSRSFCHQCNRIRVTAEGKLKLCLHHPVDCDLRELVRSGAEPEEIQKVLQERILQKPRDGHTTDESRPMWKIGG